MRKTFIFLALLFSLVSCTIIRSWVQGILFFGLVTLISSACLLVGVLRKKMEGRLKHVCTGIGLGSPLVIVWYIPFARIQRLWQDPSELSTYLFSFWNIDGVVGACSASLVSLSSVLVISICLISFLREGESSTSSASFTRWAGSIVASFGLTFVCNWQIAGVLSVKRMILSEQTTLLKYYFISRPWTIDIPVDPDMNRAIHWAALYDSVETGVAMLGMGADPSTRNVHGMTALHSAAGMGSNSMIVTLIEHGADVNAVDSSGRTPYLHAFDALASFDSVGLLLDKGANVNNCTDDQWPIYAMWTESRIANAEYLIGKGVNLNRKNGDGDTLLDIVDRTLESASYPEWIEFREIIVRHGAKTSAEIDSKEK